jgi:2-amino-4-hydroxy-6-hydroxymethyldihydropteridine diphosphokinase
VTKTAFGLGSNLGDRRFHLDAAVLGLAAAAGEVVSVSSYRETEPVGGPPQPPYLNAAAIVETELGPRDLLPVMRDLERRAGRKRGVRWGPRTLDVDLLLYGDLFLQEPDLVVPHPRLRERLFVLEPLAEIALDWPVPGTGRSVGELLADLRHHP